MVRWWHVRPSTTRVGAPPRLPASKSHAQRALWLAGFVGGEVRGRFATLGDDVVVLCDALRALGARIDVDADRIVVARTVPRPPQGELQLRENGTALRTAAAIVAILRGNVVVDGDAGLRRRSRAAVDAFLAAATGIVITPPWPWRIDATHAVWSEPFVVDASHTTQVATGAMLGLAIRAADGGARATLRVVRPTASGYVRLTADVMRAFGAAVELDDGGDDIVVRIGSGLRACRYDVLADPSAALFPATLAAIRGQPFGGTEGHDAHPDRRALDVLAAVVAPGDETRSFDLGACPDAFPALCVAAATRSGTTRFVGALALRDKESDRIAAMVAVLRTVGVDADERADGADLRGPIPRAGAAVTFDRLDDHRIVMAAALLGTQRDAGVAIADRGAVAKSWPDFFEWLGSVATVSSTSPSADRPGS